jgi:hypothetical protein
MSRMKNSRKITVEISEELLNCAQQATGEGITETVRAGLRLVVASTAYDQVRKFRGKIRFTQSLADLKSDRN